MTALRRPIESMLNGVSQQAPSLRHTSQGELQVNGLSSLPEGLIKRPALEHIARLSVSTWSSPYVFTYNRSASEQFVIVIIGGDLFAYDADGAAVTVNFPAGKTYLTSVTHGSLAHAQIEDLTYIVNKGKTVLDGGAAVGTFLGELQDTAALLAIAGPVNLDTYRIVGDGTIKAQGYYMQWIAANATWTEVAFPSERFQLTATTMPHALTYSTGTGQFTFNVVTWDEREAGDGVTVPTPDFVNRTISDVFLHRNRLGLLSGEYCSLSASGPNYEQFWGGTATALLDNDRILFRSSTERTSGLNSAVPFNKQLALFSDSDQFILSTAIGQTLTPTTGSLDGATKYAANSAAHPVTSGNSVFFPSEDKTWSEMRQYKVSSQAEIVNEAENITSHVPKFLPKGLFRIVLAPNDDMMFMLTTEQPNRIYVYKFFDEDEQTLQTSWSFWEFDASIDIKDIDVMDSKLYVVCNLDDGAQLAAISLSEDSSEADVTFPVLLDMRVELTGSYSATLNETTWTIPYDMASYTPQLVLSGDFPSRKGQLIQQVSYITVNSVTAPGDFSGGMVYMGIPYEFRYRYSEIFVRPTRTNTGGSPTLMGNLHLRNMAVRYNQTGYIRAEVIPRTGASTYTYVFSGKVLGAASLVLGTPNIDTGTFKFPVVADSSRVQIDLVNDTHVPSKLISAEWTGNFTSKRG